MLDLKMPQPLAAMRSCTLHSELRTSGSGLLMRTRMVALPTTGTS